MKILKIKIFFLVLILFASGKLLSQPPEQPPMRGAAFQRLATMKKIKLMEVLNLDETKSDKFLAKYTAYENKMISLHNNIDQVTRELDNLMKSEKVKSSELKGKIDEILKLNQEHSKLIRERLKDFQSILTDEEFAKVLLFERNFNSEIRRKIMDKGPPKDINERKQMKKRKFE